MPQQVLLTADEIRTAQMIVSKFREAQARVAMAQEMEAEYMTQLRAKYGLNESWTCYDLLDGFVTATLAAEEIVTHDQNDI